MTTLEGYKERMDSLNRARRLHLPVPEPIFSRIVKAGLGKDKYDLYEASAGAERPGDRTALKASLGSDCITIAGNVSGWGSTEISGRESIKFLRDALAELCILEGIE